MQSQSLELDKRRKVACNLCGADDTDLVFETQPKGGEAAGSKVFASTCDYLGHEYLVRCKKCGLMYFNPQMQPADIIQGYAEMDDIAYVEQAEGRLKTFEACWNKMAKYLPPKGRVLDVGAAAGFFLKVAQDRGWEARGVEPNNGLRAYAKKTLGVTIEAPTIEEASFPDNYFDAVTIWDVLEHVTDPTAVLKTIHRVTKPGGLVVVNYPDISDPFARMFGKKWWFLLTAHLTYFTPDTITQMMNKTGFEVLSIQNHYQKLPFGYLLERLKMMSPALSKVGGAVAGALGMSKMLMPYYASQRCVYARKK